MKLSKVETISIILILAMLAVAALLHWNASPVGQKILEEMKEPEKKVVIPEAETKVLPPFSDDYEIPTPTPVEPELTWKQVTEGNKYLNLTTKLGKGKKETMAVGNTLMLIVRDTRLSATTFYKRWVQSAKRENLSLKNKNLWVTVAGRGGYVEQTHHCTNFGRH